MTLRVGTTKLTLKIGMPSTNLSLVSDGFPADISENKPNFAGCHRTACCNQTYSALHQCILCVQTTVKALTVPTNTTARNIASL